MLFRKRSNVSYYIEWGDGTNTSWIGPYPSGEEISASHSWNQTGNYMVQAKAKNIYDAESDWSEPLHIIIIDLTPVILLGVFPYYQEESGFVVMMFMGICINLNPPGINIYQQSTIVIDNATKKGIFIPNLINIQEMPVGVVIGKFNATVIPYKNSNSFFSSHDSSHRPFYLER